MARVVVSPRLRDSRGGWRRFRSGLLLVLTVAVLGALLAGVVGTAIGLMITSFQHASGG